MKTFREIVARWLGQLELLVSPQCVYFVSYVYTFTDKTNHGYGFCNLNTKPVKNINQVIEWRKEIEKLLYEEHKTECLVSVENFIRIAG